MSTQQPPSAATNHADAWRGTRWLAPVVPLPVQVFRASLGRQRSFLSLTDAAAYDRGCAAYPKACGAEVGTPEAMGYADARDDAEGAAAMDDMAEWAHSHAAACGVHP